jgi:hypothetical protein
VSGGATLGEERGDDKRECSRGDLELRVREMVGEGLAPVGETERTAPKAIHRSGRTVLRKCMSMTIWNI